MSSCLVWRLCWLCESFGLGCTWAPTDEDSSDLIAAARDSHAPGFDCMWDVKRHLTDIYMAYGSPHHTSAGPGFQRLSRAVISAKACHVFRQTAKLNDLQERFRHARPGDATYESMVAARNGVMYHLLDLPPSQRVQKSHATSVAPVYELCRLATLIYAKAVLFPIPTESGWLKAALSSVCNLLEVHDGLDHRTEYLEVFCWILTIVSMAALPTIHGTYFVLRLQRYLLAAEPALLGSAEIAAHLRTACAAFLWSDMACGLALESVLEHLQVYRRENTVDSGYSTVSPATAK
jgi:hypothetical protein